LFFHSNSKKDKTRPFKQAVQQRPHALSRRQRSTDHVLDHPGIAFELPAQALWQKCTKHVYFKQDGNNWTPDACIPKANTTTMFIYVTPLNEWAEKPPSDNVIRALLDV
jgi:hypothetical protein